MDEIIYQIGIPSECIDEALDLYMDGG